MTPEISTFIADAVRQFGPSGSVYVDANDDGDVAVWWGDTHSPDLDSNIAATDETLAAVRAGLAAAGLSVFETFRDFRADLAEYI